MTPEDALWTWWIGRDRDPRRRRAVSEGTKDALAASTRARIVRRVGRMALLALAPVTGRTHQIRVHASRAGLPLLGDDAYGGDRRVVTAQGAVYPVGRVALHCAAGDITLVDCIVSLRSPVPPELVELARRLGFADAEDPFEEAITCEL